MRASDHAWAVLATEIIAWDAAAPSGEMLSDASARYVEAHPLLWRCTVIYLAGHLLHLWPTRYDPLSRLARSLGR